ncbi:MAG: nucleotidyltransferase family protein [Taibaiella sp.]|nr:nucleotidyltransferase family protein [Taibaiella sp.]
MKAMLFAAGLGTRLKPFTDAAPKALAVVGDKTLLELNIRYLHKAGIDEIIVNVHHFAGMIENFLDDNDGFGSNITISDETEQVLETGGGLKKAAYFFEGDQQFVVMNVDVLTNLDLPAMINAHRATASVATLAVMKRDSSRQLLFNNDMQLCGWRNKVTGEEKTAIAASETSEYAFSGIQILSNKIWQNEDFEGKFSLIDLYLNAAKTNKITGYNHTGDTFIDVGKPESIELARKMLTGV